MIAAWVNEIMGYTVSTGTTERQRDVRETKANSGELNIENQTYGAEES